MPLSSKILRGLDIKGWKVYRPRLGEKNFRDPAQKPAFCSITDGGEEQDFQVEQEHLEDPSRNTREEFAEERRQALAKAEEEARFLKEKAWQEGFTEGLQKGEADARKLREEAQKVLEQAQEERRQILAGAEQEIIQIAVSIAQKIINYEVETDSECVLGLISRSLEALPAGENILLHVNPLDAKICQENFRRLRALLKNGISLEILPDKLIPLGSCKVESEESEVELLLQKELEILESKLLKLAVSAGEKFLEEGGGDWKPDM
jgi:flagellar assembly protein FliH